MSSTCPNCGSVCQNWERTAVTHGLYQPHCNPKVTGTDQGATNE